MNEYFYIMTLNTGKEIKTVSGKTNINEFNPKETYEYLHNFCANLLKVKKEDTSVLYYDVFLNIRTDNKKYHYIATINTADSIETLNGYTSITTATHEELFNSIMMSLMNQFNIKEDLCLLFYKIDIA